MKLIFSTCAVKEANEMVKKLLKKKLCACVSITNVKSLYWWKNKIQNDKEALLIIKTSDKTANRLISHLKKIHSYENPEIIVLSAKASEKYSEWIEEVTKRKTAQKGH